MLRRPAVLVAFTLSGVAGLAYEVVWSRYLALLLGHTALAQVLTLSVYLGGMAVGALAVAGLSSRLARPLRVYAIAEATLAALGLLFHYAFVSMQQLAQALVFPSLGPGPASMAVGWVMGALLLLPPAVVLGATFPLMAAALERADQARPGRGVALAYLANTLGGAGGVLLAGFLLVPRWGLPGALLGAALLNAAAAALAVLGDGGEQGAPSAPARQPEAAAGRDRPLRLERLLLTVSFGTALASFAYEIAWIRLLSLVLGSATHAFELMLSAFILGLAVGSFLVRGIVDRAPAPLRLVGALQWLMGLAALATVPLYGAAFEAMAALLRVVPVQAEGGYLLVNLTRYSIALGVMLPATVLAGMTLPAITAALLRAGSGERAIGRVYGFNTVGSVAGALAAGLALLPALGLKGLLVAAAALDMGLGVWLFSVAARRGEGGGALVPVWGGLAGAFCLAVLLGVGIDRAVLTSGVFRYWEVPTEEVREILYFRDGRTSTVGVHRLQDPDLVILTTNGKPEGSLSSRWFDARRDTLPVLPLPPLRDAATQTLAPLVGLAHNPAAARIANVGHGTGMTGVTLLASPDVRELVTVEIEPAIVEGSRTFLPANRAVFEDPRSRIVLADAKTFFAAGTGPFDVVVSEPSNPWVGGVASLFTREFYESVRRVLAPGGVLVQWIQLYESEDALFLTVLAALDPVFPRYRGYLVGDADVLIVAGAGEGPGEPDWSVFQLPEVRELLRDVPPFLPGHLDPLLVLDESTLRPLVRTAPVNSDFHPHLDAGAERARFRGGQAEGVLSLARDRLDLWRIRSGRAAVPETSFAPPPAAGLAPAVDRALGVWLRSQRQGGEGPAPAGYPEWDDARTRHGAFHGELAGREPANGWSGWTRRFLRAEHDLHRTTAGWTDEEFYRDVAAFLDRAGAPAEARAVVAVMEGVSGWDFERAARAGAELAALPDRGAAWIETGLLTEATALASLRLGRPAEARRLLELGWAASGRGPDDLRFRLLEAWSAVQ